MDRKYIAPQTEVLPLQDEEPILITSLGRSSESTDMQLSKKHPYSSFNMDSK